MSGSADDIRSRLDVSLVVDPLLDDESLEVDEDSELDELSRLGAADDVREEAPCCRSCRSRRP